KRTFTTKELALTGVMAALSLVAYLFFRVPFYGGSSFHLGNTFKELTGAGLISADEMMECLALRSRDNARTPVQWDDSPNAGFT
ncbi:alpha-amylase family glycosyl hydrolase, partial [Faecalibacterium duncaniae]|nr:hypothetical protein [Faecalibacterium duncaniae]